MHLLLHLWSLLQCIQCPEVDKFFKNGILKNLSLKKLLSSHQSILFLCWILSLALFFITSPMWWNWGPQKEQRQNLVDIIQGELYFTIRFPDHLAYWGLTHNLNFSDRSNYQVFLPFFFFWFCFLLLLFACLFCRLTQSQTTTGLHCVCLRITT